MQLTYFRYIMRKHTHHIIPKFAGGTNHYSNLVKLTPLQHCRAHYERWVAYGDKRDRWAFRLLLANYKKAKYDPESKIEHGRWLAENFGKKNLTREHQQKAALAWKRKREESGWINPVKGKTFQEEEKKRLYPKATCPICGLTGNARAIKQWHGLEGEKCRSGGE